jgi:hypothetical protein
LAVVFAKGRDRSRPRVMGEPGNLPSVQKVIWMSATAGYKRQDAKR